MSGQKERAVATGDQIRVNYVGCFENGSTFDSSEGREPLECTVGAEQVIAGFDRAVIGLKAGESCKVVVVPEDGYGAHVPDMVVEVEHARLGTMKTLGFPVKLSDSPASIRRAAPLLGQHTREVLLAHGYTEDGVVELQNAGVIVCG